MGWSSLVGSEPETEIELERAGGGSEKHRGVTDPIRPLKPGRRGGGEASWTPQIGQGKTRVWDIFRGPHENMAR